MSASGLRILHNNVLRLLLPRHIRCSRLLPADRLRHCKPLAVVSQRTTGGWFTGSPLGGAGVLTRERGPDQFQQGPCQVAPSDQNDVVIGADVIHGPSRHRPVRRRDIQGCPGDEVVAAVGVSAVGGVQHPTADAALPGHLGDHDPHLSQCAAK